MNPTVSTSPVAPLLFNWEAPRRRKVAIAGFLGASIIAHAICFYLFQIVYPPTIALLPAPARVSLIGDIVVDVVGGLLGPILGHGFHATGRRLIFLFTLGFVRVPSLRHGGADNEGLSDFGVGVVGFLFWVAAIALILYLLLA